MRIQGDGPAPPLPPTIKISIRLVLPSPEHPKGYIGASTSYPPLPGETWSRGGDLADGPANSETLASIMRDIEAVMAGFPNAHVMDNP